MGRTLRTGIAVLLTLVVLFALHVQLNLGGWPRFVKRFGSGGQARGELVVGFLPVTCHLTCPVTSWITAHSEAGAVFRSKKYTEFATIAEEFKSGQLKASFILAALAMTLRRQGLPIKIVYLGHRDGTTLVVAKSSSIHSFADLRSKTIAIPHRYSNQRILLERQIERFGFGPHDLHMVVYPPPEMPSALQKGAIVAYIVGEPFAAKSEIEGYGRVLAFTKDMWPNFISCVLAVSEDLARENRPLVQELVDGIAASGRWIDAPGQDLAPGVHRAEEGVTESPTLAVIPGGWDATHRSQAATIAARKQYYDQNPELLRFVLSKPPDRVRYTGLVPARADFEEIQRYAERLDYFRASTPADPFGFTDYCDTTFALSANR